VTYRTLRHPRQFALKQGTRLQIYKRTCDVVLNTLEVVNARRKMQTTTKRNIRQPWNRGHELNASTTGPRDDKFIIQLNPLRVSNTGEEAPIA
jgi:hypothetical protein